MRGIAEIRRMQHRLTCLTLFLLSGCGANKWEQQAVVPSPDHTLKAAVEYKDAAACCSDHSRLRLSETSKGTLREDPGIVVEVTNAQLVPHWESNNRLIVEGCGATEYEAITRIYRQEATLADGTENAIRIELISIPDTIRNGVAYCTKGGD
ncbi:hypothetical protein GRI97_06015 [Altererythrobacter xixiisoli]|uniref:Lipoprotein n=1 Tax=Croceibacterium xixiisoli TaxID=1476466 RepID=A0A6I4TTJ5_9SPHN|nr:hypothetical protein [Croceibacterium xixiisoli]MXO98540.1 hypothetical protein [Croceibacterium xixiisoli]